MGKFLNRIAIAATMFALASTSNAAEEIEIVGMGATPCSQYLREIGSDTSLEREYLSWALGYMSGLLVRAPVGEIVQLRNPALPLLKQAALLREYCANNPNESVSVAVQELYKLLRSASPKSL